MDPVEYEIAFFAQTVFRISRSSDVNELAAVACTIRNHVVPRLGQVGTYPSFEAACLDFLKVYPNRDLPLLTDPAFVSHPDGLLHIATDIYDCSYPDITATQDHPGGAKFFNHVSDLPADDWFYIEVISQPEKHPLLGTFGGMQFFC